MSDSQYEPEYVEENGLINISRIMENSCLDHHVLA